MPSIDKLSVCNDELLLCGQNPVATAEDGSPEWNCTSAAYETAVEYLIDKANWKFATAIEDVDERTGDSADADYADEYALPTGWLHLISVKDQGGTDLDWKLVGNRVLVNCDAGITVKIVQDVLPNQWSGLFAAAVRGFVRAGIYRGLLKNPAEARAEQTRAEAIITEARPRIDSQEPARAKFVSSLAAARRNRRG